jgi:mersacidin/lichenicidin family type 2 lantibiotic
MAVDIARAWKDPEYRKSLTPEELANLPPNPAGGAALSDEELERLSGGLRGAVETSSQSDRVVGCCP